MFDSIKFDEATYEIYSRQLDDVTEEKIAEMKRQMKSKQSIIGNIDNQINAKVELLGKTTVQAAIDKINKEIEELAISRDELKEQYEALDEKVKNASRIKLSKDDFLNLANSLGTKMRNADAVQKDLIARKVFVNLILDDEKQLIYRCKEPFDVLLGMGKTNLVGAAGLEPATNRL